MHNEQNVLLQSIFLLRDDVNDANDYDDDNSVMVMTLMMIAAYWIVGKDGCAIIYILRNTSGH